ncbi:MAG: putative phage tail protein, partial [Leclercia adecarboxylata]|nr:putative phage tail protein [Leclercia adecarboxylata]
AFSAVHSRVSDLVLEANPSTTTELLDRWEYCSGLPDSCSVPGTDTTEERQRRVATKFNLVGGITKEFYLAVLESLGYEGATITTFEDEGREYDWQVNIPKAATISNMTCLGNCTDYIRIWGATEAECVLDKLCASHTILSFTYQD